MKRCLKCYLPLEEGEIGEWHRRCSRSFFTADEPPLIALDDETIQTLAKESSKEGWSIAGVQQKLSLAALVKEDTKRFHPSLYILKPQSPDHPHLPQLESVAMLDLTNLFYLLVFSFVIGNNDMHLKNFSLYTPERGRTMLTPAYDLLPVTLVLPQDKEETALTLSGKKNKITRRDFLSLAKAYTVPDKVAVNLISRLLTMQDEFTLIIRRSFLDESLQAQLIALIEERMRRLSV